MYKIGNFIGLGGNGSRFGSSLDPTLFISSWKTDNSGTSTDTQISIPVVSNGTYDCHVDWGDGTSDDITTWDDAAWTHEYGTGNEGTYEVKISGTSFKGILFYNAGDEDKIVNISQIGLLELVNNGSRIFRGCSNLTITATDTIQNTGGFTTFLSMFHGCSSLVRVPLFDTSSATTIQWMFQNCSALETVPLYDFSSVNIGAATFSGCSSLLNVPTFDLRSLTYGTDIFKGVTMSTESYSNILINLELLNSNNSYSFHGGNATYNVAGGVARAALIADHTVTFTDGGAA